MKYKREEVYKAIDSERNYQDAATELIERPDMIVDLHLGDTIAAMQYNLDKAREAWYKNATPHTEAMTYIRKICGLGVRMGEEQGMPFREETKDPLEGKCPSHYLGECAMDKCEDCTYVSQIEGAMPNELINMIDRFNYVFKKGTKVRFEPEIIKHYKKYPPKNYDFVDFPIELLDSVGTVVDVYEDTHTFSRGSLYIVDVQFGDEKVSLMAGNFTEAEE